MNVCLQTIDLDNANRVGGGLASYIRTMAGQLKVLGHRVCILAPSPDGRRHIRTEQGVRVYRVPLPNLHWYLAKIPILGATIALPWRELEWGWGFWKEFRRICNQESVDVLESGEVGNLFHAWQGQIPFVVRAHGDLYSVQRERGMLPVPGQWLARLMQRWCFGKAQALIVPSRFLARAMRAECGSRVAIEVVPNPVDPMWRKPCARTRSRNVVGEDKVILFAGRMHAIKGIDVLLRAIPEVIREVPEAVFTFAGPQDPSFPNRRWEKILGDIAIGPHIRRLGSVSRKRLRHLYAGATLVTIPSHYETFSLVCAEAMVCAKPVVASKRGALPELVTHGKTGLLFEPVDSHSLAGALVHLLRSPVLCAKMGREGRAKALRFPTPGQIARREEALYRKARNGYRTAA